MRARARSWVGLLVALLPILATQRATAQPDPAPAGLWRLERAGWTSGTHEGTSVAQERLTLAPGREQGAFVARMPEGRAPFDRLLLSLNPDPFPTGSRVRARVRLLGAEGRWTAWLPLGEYGGDPALPRSEPDPGDPIARVDVDVIRAEVEVTQAELRLELVAGAEGAAPRLRRVAISTWSTHARSSASPPAREVARPAAWGRTLAVPTRSQRVLPRGIAGRACSPTSLAMALAHHGVARETLAVAEGVFDRGADLYGNWSFNVAYAATAGLEALAVHLDGLADLEAELAAGRPVVISHRYGPGELEGSPLNATDGHLLVVVGFTETGDVVVNDPAGPPDRVRRVYRRDQLARAWQERADGVAYLLRKEAAESR